MFAVNKWGFAADRGNDGNYDVAGYNVSVTGHRTNPGSTPNSAGTVGTYCGPCHPGNMVGGFRQYKYGEGTDAVVGGANVIKRATAYGCDQCHDAIGVKTMTTAWPHGNSRLFVYEWPGQGATTIQDAVEAKALGRNLWMYQGNVTGFGAPSDRSALFDPQFTLVSGGVSGGGEYKTFGNIRDGVCLKCHMPYDSASLDAMNMGIDGDYGLEDMMAGHHTLAGTRIFAGGIDRPGKDLAPDFGFSPADNLEPEGNDMAHLIWTYR
jgi:hypothetical protein